MTICVNRRWRTCERELFRSGHRRGAGQSSGFSSRDPQRSGERSAGLGAPLGRRSKTLRPAVQGREGLRRKRIDQFKHSSGRLFRGSRRRQRNGQRFQVIKLFVDHSISTLILSNFWGLLLKFCHSKNRNKNLKF